MFETGKRTARPVAASRQAMQRTAPRVTGRLDLRFSPTAGPPDRSEFSSVEKFPKRQHALVAFFLQGLDSRFRHSVTSRASSARRRTRLLDVETRIVALERGTRSDRCTQHAPVTFRVQMRLEGSKGGPR